MEKYRKIHSKKFKNGKTNKNLNTICVGFSELYVNEFKPKLTTFISHNKEERNKNIPLWVARSECGPINERRRQSLK